MQDGDGDGHRGVPKEEIQLEGGLTLRIFHWSPIERTVVISNPGNVGLSSEIEGHVWSLSPGAIHIFRQHRDTEDSPWPELTGYVDQAWEYEESDISPFLEAVAFMAQHWEEDHRHEPLGIYIERPAINGGYYQWDGMHFHRVDGVIKLLSREEDE